VKIEFSGGNSYPQKKKRGQELKKFSLGLAWEEIGKTPPLAAGNKHLFSDVRVRLRDCYLSAE